MNSDLDCINLDKLHIYIFSNCANIGIAYGNIIEGGPYTMREADKKDNMKINREGARIITLTGLFMALICVATLFFKVPIPLGYAHLGNGFIFLAAVFLKNPYAMTATGVGSALADLLGGYAEWIIPTLIIKCLMGALISLISANGKVKSVRTFLAVLAGAVEMVAGYTVAGALLYGSIPVGFAQIPGLTAEGIVGMVLFYVVGAVCEKAGVKKYFVQHNI